LKELAPWGLRGIADHVEFAKSYRGRLDAFGVETLAIRFAEISRAHHDRGLVLLCFEPAGAFCHRRVFAEWWLQRTGQQVPELTGEQPPLFESTAKHLRLPAASVSGSRTGQENSFPTRRRNGQED
jgi:hypothetical protein